jgi:deoxyribodipyrimidine photo-lyase
LKELQKSLSEIGLNLIVRKGKVQAELADLIKATKASSIFWNRIYDPDIANRDTQIKAHFKSKGIEVKSFAGSLLCEPWDVQNGSGKPYQVFTPFWKAIKDRKFASPLPAPSAKKQSYDFKLQSLAIDDLKLVSKINWHSKFPERWQAGERSALSKLNNFLSTKVSNYNEQRNFPSVTGVSELSPHLHFGEISPLTIWHAALNYSNSEPFMRQLGWRDFAHHLLFHFQDTVREPLRSDFKNFPWEVNSDLLSAWQKGMTGYPIVDAGMRELWTTGIMHNRVRMIVGSFLVKHLLQPWQAGADWFWDTLVDADLANNVMGWQWVAGCGADAAPYFRIFNPVLQSEKFDAEAIYIKKYIPELSAVPAKYIHEISAAPIEVLKQAGVVLGKDYPLPIVGLQEGRDRALNAYQKIKRKA